MYQAGWMPFTLFFIILGALGYGFSFGLYPDFRDDQSLSKEAFLCVVIWSGIVLLPLALSFLAAFGIVLWFPLLYELLGLGMLAGWIWNWIVIADTSTWDKIHEDYVGIYAIIITYQVLYSIWLVWYLSFRMRHGLSALVIERPDHTV